MNRTLGIDLGSNSLGWAILDDLSGDILDKGVVVFPEGMDLDAKSSLETPAATRRMARMGRRMKFRRKLRKWKLLELLIGAGMCPLEPAELKDWRENGKYPLANKAFLQWLKATDTSNPYCDRAAAAEGKVAPHTLGRALYHIVQRRGFRSSRKEEAELVDEETGEVKKQDKELGEVKTGIAELSREIADAGCKTLGQYFFRRLAAEKGSLAKTRIRGRYTGRLEHYEKEFAVIMDAQGYASGDVLRVALHKAIFWQRPLRSQKHLVGKCPLEPRNARAQIGHPAFEEFRMLSFVNNLSLQDADDNYRDDDGNLLYPLTARDRELVCSAFMRAAPSIRFSAISRLFGRDRRFREGGLSFHYYRDDDSVPTCQTRHRISAAFADIPYDEQTVFDALMFFDDTDKLRDWFRRHYPRLDDKAIARLLSIHPKEGNANYSLKAINKMLPFLRQGYELSQARLFAKLPDIIPDFAAHEREILNGLGRELLLYRQERRRYAELLPCDRKTAKAPVLLDRYREYLSKNWGVKEDKWNRLYLRGDRQYEPMTEYTCKGVKVALPQPRLPAVDLGMIRNPLVQRAMTTLRRLVNYLGEHGKIGTDDTIRIELARSVNDFATRKAWQNWQNKRRKLREEAVAEIVKAGAKPTEDAIERCLLWKEQKLREEQNGVCLYTQNSIGLAELLFGKAFDVEHTIPRSLSGDDSLANKTICDAAYNRDVKQGRIPRQCPNRDEIYARLAPWHERVERLERDYRNRLRAVRAKTDPAQRSQARVAALEIKFELDYWRDKLRRFEITPEKLQAPGGVLGGFKKRQLVDTGIMCSHAVDLLRSVYPATFAVNGAATAFARKAWGIQGDGGKDRTEHTHHAKDAMVIAALTPSRFMTICSALKDDGSDHRRECDVCPPPYAGFAQKVRTACDEILVKHVLRQTTMRQSSRRNVLAHAHREKGNPNGRLVKYVKSQGDTVRGEIHNKTFYGKIVNPKSKTLCVVERKTLVGESLKGKALDDLLKCIPRIVDGAIRAIVKEGVERLIANGASHIGQDDLKMPSGVPIRKVRVIAPSKFQSPGCVTRHSHASAKEYKRFLWAGSAEGSNFRMAIFFQRGEYSFQTEDILSWASHHKSVGYCPPDGKVGFIGYVYPGAMVLTHKGGGIEELMSCDSRELSKRLYYVRSLPSSKKDARGELQLHLEARAKNEISAEDRSSEINYETPKRLLRVTASNMCSKMLFERIHFRMMLDGTIQFLKQS